MEKGEGFTCRRDQGLVEEEMATEGKQKTACGRDILETGERGEKGWLTGRKRSNRW